MSMVLSIYSQKGFREITLPERGANELQILLQKELFALETDIRLTAERSDDVWSVRTQDGAVFVREADCGNQDCVQQGAMSLDNYTQRFLGNLILCLPHKLEIQLLQNP